MAETEPVSSPFENFQGTRHWKIWAMSAAMVLVAAGGTWVAGQYKIGRLDSMLSRYEQPITDYARTAERVRKNSMESEWLESCKQAQIGTWLQTTDALAFENPVAGNRVIIRLDPARAHLDLNGRDLSLCISDEIENRQFDIGSMTNTWALVLFIISLGLGAWSWFGWEAWRRRASRPAMAADETAADQPQDGAETPSVSDDQK